jgi:hypothetical protein
LVVFPLDDVVEDLAVVPEHIQEEQLGDFVGVHLGAGGEHLVVGVAGRVGGGRVRVGGLEAGQKPLGVELAQDLFQADESSLG